MKIIFTFLLVFFIGIGGNAQKILFDASKAESAGNSDWIIDADQFNLGFSSGPAIAGTGDESNAQRIPTPDQSGINAATLENYWTGGLSAWGVDCAKRGYRVETLPYNGMITYGNLSNPQDLGKYKVFIVCEPNIVFTTAEKAAILNFVNDGGGLFMISDHDTSDRNNDGWDSPRIWNDLMNNNTVQADPFGLTFDYADFSETTSNILNDINDPILYGPMGNVTSAKWSRGTSLTLNNNGNATTKGVVFKTFGSTNTTGVMCASATYGKGRVVAFGDSSPCDDATGDPNDNLFNGYFIDASGNHQRLLMNATIWLASNTNQSYTFTGNGDWNLAANWMNNNLPPPSLPGGSQIIINPAGDGECILNTQQTISSGASLTIKSGKKFRITSDLIIQ